MLDTKSFLSSRTVWANIIGFVCIALSMLGINTGFIDQSVLTDTVLQLIAGASFIVSTIARVIATKKITA